MSNGVAKIIKLSNIAQQYSVKLASEVPLRKTTLRLIHSQSTLKIHTLSHAVSLFALPLSLPLPWSSSFWNWSRRGERKRRRRRDEKKKMEHCVRSPKGDCKHTQIKISYSDRTFSTPCWICHTNLSYFTKTWRRSKVTRQGTRLPQKITKTPVRPAGNTWLRPPGDFPRGTFPGTDAHAILSNTPLKNRKGPDKSELSISHEPL